MQINIRRKIKNWMQLEFQAISENEQLARIAVASFITPLNPTLEEMADVKTAVSEAVTNAIIHGYEEKEGVVYLRCRLNGDLLEVEIEDKGMGIDNIEQACKKDSNLELKVINNEELDMSVLSDDKIKANFYNQFSLKP